VPFAVLYQALPAPPIGGCYKPQKPNGYRDSSADIAWALQVRGQRVITPVKQPDPAVDSDWSFADTAEGIAAALAAGADTLWANTVVYVQHPIRQAIDGGCWIVGQSPTLSQQLEDKWFVHQTLRKSQIGVPQTLKVGRATVNAETSALSELTSTTIDERLGGFPVIVKPVRGRGSQGVLCVQNLGELTAAVESLLTARSDFAGTLVPTYGDFALVEEFLPGEECTVGVLPDAAQRAMPPVVRTGHSGGVVPYSGVVPVVANSRLMPGEHLWEPAQKACQQAVAKLLPNPMRAIVRIDCRQNRQGEWCLFDFNLKPNLTGHGRPGRDDQDSLIAIAAAAWGWSYPELIDQLASYRWQKAERG